MNDEPWAKGYVSPTVCADGEDSHEWENTVMVENGCIEIPVRHCKKCGFYM